MNQRNSFFDYCSYIAARDNNYILLTGDWKLKKVIDEDIQVNGVLWYVENLREKGIIDDYKLLEIYEILLNDSSVYIKDDILIKLINELKNKINN